MTQETTPVTDSAEPLVSIKDLEIGFQTGNGFVQAVKGVSFDIFPGETVAIVGESGSGKSTTATGIIDLLPSNGRITGGQVMFGGKDLTKASKQEIVRVRGREIGYVPQDPMSNLNPVWSVGFQVREAVLANNMAKNKKDADRRAIEVLQEAGLADAERRMKQFPHQFSGGMRQRVLIGIGLAADPKLLIADEPTSALDVTVQRVILDHLESLTREKNTALLLITHDLGLAAERASKVIVMYQGKIVEAGPSLELLQNPQHPYTKRLIAAAPSLASQRLKSSRVVAEAPQGDEIDLAAASAHRHEVVEQADHAGTPAIEVKDLTKVFSIRRGSFRSEPFTAVDKVNFQVPRGTTMALVGESGSGKSTVAKMVLGLETATEGEILIGGKDATALNREEMLAHRRRMQPVFQDPYGSLDPMRSIGSIIQEPLDVHKIGGRKERENRVNEVIDEVALPRTVLSRYPNELSGGQRQRIAIARALALKPDVVILDEAVSALDVLVQAQILQLLADLQEELGLTYLFITHDLAVVRVVADDVAVMERGKIVEHGKVEDIFTNAQTEYTQKLLDAIPGANIPLGA
ncbi:ABC transporter ATP-binding protein [Demequina sp. SYSU T00192]|uniref:ABC transporter ATP-binding protein n=1 Tax=Demequina litoralis TaxID=3051660 RepID=A0ABT8GAB3_9MICO|nr:ABC transporter ATP-binding protein [Demequina sp. SYSU T00192]MDN4475639.1 ABC transporter ATP-binding protein [Demequina sp. SYSU T00192]